MIRLAIIEEVRPGMKLHIKADVFTVHSPAHFWENDLQGNGFICCRKDASKTAEIITVRKGEKVCIE
jgi:hypothetical protein